MRRCLTWNSAQRPFNDKHILQAHDEVGEEGRPAEEKGDEACHVPFFICS